MLLQPIIVFISFLNNVQCLLCHLRVARWESTFITKTRQEVFGEIEIEVEALTNFHQLWWAADRLGGLVTNQRFDPPQCLILRDRDMKIIPDSGKARIVQMKACMNL